MQVAGGGVRIETPDLHVAYSSFEVEPIRPHRQRPSGPTLDQDAPDDNWSEGSSRWRHPWGKAIPKV
eukprot:SAG11_NODE_33859_length_275_cov_0.579545_1_plen_66_part_10